MLNWSFLTQRRLITPEILPEEVLAEFDGPVILLAFLESSLHLGVAVEELSDIEGGVRWLFAPVSRLELAGLARSAVTTREVFEKAAVAVVDLDGEGVPLRHWMVPSTELSDGHLPNRGAYLPQSSRVLLAKYDEMSTPTELVLNQVDDGTHGVSFRGLSAALDIVQRLCSAMVAGTSGNVRGRHEVGVMSQSRLSVVAAHPGSVRIEVESADEKSFARVVSQLGDLVGEGGENPNLLNMLSELTPRARGRFEELLEGLDKHGLQLLLGHRESRVFFSPQRARRILGEWRKKPTVHRDLFTTVGYFRGFNFTAQTFEFVELDADNVLKGVIGKDFDPPRNHINVAPNLDDSLQTFTGAFARTREISPGHPELVSYELLRALPYSVKED